MTLEAGNPISDRIDGDEELLGEGASVNVG